MAISAGTRLGPYEILSPIGAGGMGEVYQARDTRLERIVAIKVLPAHLAGRADLRERFEREARTIANLKHPNICVLHDIGEQDGIHYLVMEYLDGETLALRLMKGALPLDQVLRYASEISDALDRAHRNGFTHRDIKPGNIMLTKEGSKILDFGLAKLKQEAAQTNIPQSQVPTEPSAPPPFQEAPGAPARGTGLTADGTILGTVQYMAPEQVEGKIDDIDPRTDIFSFGATVYEMATGRKAFEGKSQASVFAAILKEEPPPMSSLQPMTPPALDRVVKKCLEKEPERRWQSASDLTDALKWIKEGSLQAPAPAAPAVKGIRAGWQRTTVWGVASLVLAAIVGIAVWNLRPAPATGSQQVSRSVIPLPPNGQLAATSGEILALSPDGTQLAYVASSGSGQQLYLRAMDSLEARPIPGTDGAFNPFFSPDGQWIGFFAGGKLKKVSVSGGATLTLCNATTPRGATWGPNDTIALTPTSTGALYQVSAAGGEPQLLTKLASGEVNHRWPQFLPDGKAILFTVQTAGTDGNVAVERLDTGEYKVLIRGGSYARYVPTGHLVYYRAGTMMAAPFDLARLELKANPSPVLEDIMSSSVNPPAGQFSFSSLGSLVYVPGGPQSADLNMVWVDRHGADQPLPAPAHAYSSPKLSPDGRQVLESFGGNVWIYDLSRDTLTRLTFEGNSSNQNWTPDGKRIVFLSNKSGHNNLYWKLADGSGPEERLTTSEYDQTPGSFTPDGKTLVYQETNPKTGNDIWVLPLEGDPGQSGAGRKPRVFLQTPFEERAVRLSPDGHWLAYISDESGQFELYVRPFPGPGGKWQISTDGGAELAWSPKGNEIFYRTGPNRQKMMAVDIQTQPTFSAGKPRLLFEGPYYAGTAAGNQYSVARDGQRFLMLKAKEQQAAALTQINVVLNWFEELKRRVPSGQ